MQYNSIVPSSQQWWSLKYPDWSSLAGTSKEVTAPIPDSSVHSYPAPSTKRWKDSPESGLSWSEVQKLRKIKMTPYSVGKSSIEYHLMRYDDISWNTSWIATYKTKTSTNPPLYYVSPIRTAESKFIQFTDMERHLAENPDIPHYSWDKSYDISKESNEVMSKVVEDSFSNFDLLTNLAEFPETLEMIVSILKRARKPLEGIKELIDKYKRAQRRGKSHSEAHDEIASQWMQYRYGIMPLVLSIQDAIELLDQSASEFKTSRASSTKDFNRPGTTLPINVPRRYFFDEVSGIIKVRAVGKTKFFSEGLRLSDQITFNPFLTAWELIPMSFVIDWFVNVGDVIFANTSTVMDLAEERKFCLSVKKDLMIETRYVSDYSRSYVKTAAAWPTNSPGSGIPAGFQPAVNVSKHTDYHLDCLAKTEIIESYDRSLFKPTDVNFQWNPSISWRRSIDGYILSLSNIRKVLKALQK